MNPRLNLLQPYPFEKLRQLFTDTPPADAYKNIRLSIGEPQHPTPDFIRETLANNLNGLANYPTTAGGEPLRKTISDWIARRYDIPAPDFATQVLPVNGSREALFAIAQCVVNPTHGQAQVLCPNPFYQIYEGATLLAGAQPIFLNQVQDKNFAFAVENIPPAAWKNIQLVYVCSPSNPTGQVLTLDEWKTLFALSDEHGFIIAADECYSEIYFNEPPLGALQAAQQLGRKDYRHLVVFSSLSKRSNVPGMRSGFVAGDAQVLKSFLLYRTYHGCAMNPAVQQTSIVAWNDEAHVEENRRLYREKFAAVQPMLNEVLGAPMPEAGFYLWARTPISDTEFARRLHGEYNVTVLPGSYLARPADGTNPGEQFIRIALVASVAECLEAAERIQDFCRKL